MFTQIAFNDYYCPDCKLQFGALPDKTTGVVTCPLCGKSRTDGFNQVNPTEIRCISCRAVTSINNLSQPPKCINHLSVNPKEQ